MTAISAFVHTDSESTFDIHDQGPETIVVGIGGYAHTGVSIFFTPETFERFREELGKFQVTKPETAASVGIGESL
jgi:hypothetical protein